MMVNYDPKVAAFSRSLDIGGALPLEGLTPQRLLTSFLERRVLTVTDQFDVNEHDAQALEENALLANLIVATSEHRGRVPQERIDEILGVAAAVPGTGGTPTPEATGTETGDMSESATSEGETPRS